MWSMMFSDNMGERQEKFITKRACYICSEPFTRRPKSWTVCLAYGPGPMYLPNNLENGTEAHLLDRLTEQLVNRTEARLLGKTSSEWDRGTFLRQNNNWINETSFLNQLLFNLQYTVPLMTVGTHPPRERVFFETRWQWIFMRLQAAGNWQPSRDKIAFTYHNKMEDSEAEKSGQRKNETE